jgi:hypothetical protein
MPRPKWLSRCSRKSSRLSQKTILVSGCFYSRKAQRQLAEAIPIFFAIAQRFDGSTTK